MSFQWASNIFFDKFLSSTDKYFVTCKPREYQPHFFLLFFLRENPMCINYDGKHYVKLYL